MSKKTTSQTSKKRKPLWKRWWVWVIGIIFVSALFADPESTETATTTTEATTADVSTTTATEVEVAEVDTEPEPSTEEPSTEETPAIAEATTEEAVQETSAAPEETSAQESSETSEPPPVPSTPEPPQPKPTTYEVARFEDISIRALERPLSSYTQEELQRLPLNKRLVYRVVIPPTITQEQVVPTLRQVVEDVIGEDSDVDELTVFMYSAAELANGAYDIGRAVWAYEGQEGTIPARVARSNNRSRHEIVFDVQPDIEAYIAQRNTQEERFGLTEEQRREWWRRYVQAERQAVREADEEYPPNVDSDRNYAYSVELRESYWAQLREEYGLSEEQQRAVRNEAFDENWPTN